MASSGSPARHQVAPNHTWVSDHREYFVQGLADDVRNDPASFIEAGGKEFAWGRDPIFRRWPDVVQFNAFQPGLRQAVIETIAERSRFFLVCLLS
jgi:hypothetical protein